MRCNFQTLVCIVFIVHLVPAHGAYPGAREGAVGWIENNKLWLFGGLGYAENSTFEGFLNDLWSYDISTNTWTFVAGDKVTNPAGSAGNLNTFSPTYRPEGVKEMCAWLYNNSLWIFGGANRDDLRFTDVWRFDLALNQWGRIFSTARNSPGDYNLPPVPGSRSNMQCQLVNNNVVVFGGYGLSSTLTGHLQDLWSFDHVQSWDWLSGFDAVDCPGSLATRDAPSTTQFPPCQQPASSWLASNQDIVFAGGSFPAGNFSQEMYRVNAPIKEWTWLSSTVLSRRNRVGSASDGLGKAWLFGGEDFLGRLSDLIEWDGTTWQRLKGPTNAEEHGNYPALGSADANSNPGGRVSPVMWRDNSGDLWLFGGYGYGESAGLGHLNDFWKYSYTLETWTWVGGSKVVNQKGNFSNAAPVTPQSDDEPEAVLSPSTDTPNAQTNIPVNPPVFPSETDQILLGVLLSVGLGGVGLVVLIVMLKKRKKQKKQKQNATKQPSDYVNGTQEIRQSFVDHYANVNAPNSDDRYAAINGNQGAIDAVPLDTLVMNDANSRLIPHKAITLEKEIGVGSYGKVYLGKLRTTKVAVKVANTKISQEDFVKEASFQLAIPPHPNIVQLLGISVDGPQPLVVLEYCNEGSLDKLLFETDKLSTPAEQIALAEAIARGLDHLHQNNIVHRDLAVRNVLLHHGEPKISDFGMSRKLKEASQVGKTAANIGPIRWMAPEALGKQLYSTKSDVWTFGLVLYEIVARQEPHASDNLFNVGLKIRDEGYTPEVPKTCPPVLHQIMQMCWKVDPEQRPEMSTICELLDQK